MRMGARFFAVVMGLALLGLTAPAHAQWMWKDDAGHTMISDQPPPANVPESRILRSPNGRGMSATPAAPAPLTDDATKQKSTADQDLEYKKHQKELADAAKKQQDEAAKDQEMQQRCQALRANLQTLQSGVRIARTDDQGQRYFVDDSQRAAETQKVQSDVASSCK